jgi:hypothetical protein
MSSKLALLQLSVTACVVAACASKAPGGSALDAGDALPGHADASTDAGAAVDAASLDADTLDGHMSSSDAAPSDAGAADAHSTACGSGSFNVMSYGAVGDGITDDAPSIQRAIDAAEAAGGGEVCFAAHTYLLDSSSPSSHPWFFYNLIVGSNVSLSGAPGAKLLQGPNGRHALVVGATVVGNTVLAVGRDYAAVRFQDPQANGGFYALEATRASSSTIALATASDASHFHAGDYVAIYEHTVGDVLPTEAWRLHGVDAAAGVLTLETPLARGFASPSIANVTAIATTNVGVDNLIIEGATPISATEVFGFTSHDNQYVIDTSIGGSNILALNMNTLRGFSFVHDTFTSTRGGYANFELPQRNSASGVFRDTTFRGSAAGFGEFGARWTFSNDHFWLYADGSIDSLMAIGGLDVVFDGNDVHQAGNITASSGWGAVLDDFVAGDSSYASYVGGIKITNNTFECRADGNSCLGIHAGDTLIAGNTLHAMGSANAIHIEGPSPQSIVVRANTISIGSGMGILLATAGFDGSTITQNTLLGTGSVGIFVASYPTPNTGADIITNNMITGFATHVSIDLMSHPGSTVANN